MSVKFYYGCASGAERLTLKLISQIDSLNVMINYATQNNEPWNDIENLFIDSGGYSFMKGKGEYTTTDRKYLEFIEKHSPELFALRDYPCEPDVLEEHGRTVEDHLEATVKRHRNLLKLLSGYSIDSKPVAVIQGWETEDYIRHAEMLENAGIIGQVDYVAIGSVCRRGQIEDLKEIIRAVANKFPDKKVHAFGVKKNILQFQEMRQLLDSADSLAYSSRARYDAQDKMVSNDFYQEIIHFAEFKKEIEKYLGQSYDQKRIHEVVS